MKTSGSREPDGFAESLRAAIDARDVSLVWLRDRLAKLGSPVSLTTLSYWRTGRRHPEGASSLAAIAAIEELLHVPPAHLTSALAPSRRTGPLPSPEVPLDDAVRAATEETLQALAAAPLSAIRDVSTQVVADVDEHGHIRRRWTRILVQATSGHGPGAAVGRGRRRPHDVGARSSRRWSVPGSSAPIGIRPAW